MVNLTELQLKKIIPYASSKNIKIYTSEFNKVLPLFSINTPLRICHFLAQVAHESGSLNYTKEIASGEAYDTGKKAINLGNTPEKDGDGQRYKGRGLIQLTGLSNYKAFQKWLNRAPDIIKNPSLLEQPHLATLVSCWFWDSRNLNELADKDDFKSITKRINGGYNGLSDRLMFLTRAKAELIK